MSDAKISDLEALLKSLEEKADAATPGEWVWGAWTIFDSDREAQRKQEPYWTLIQEKYSQETNLCVGPFGRKAFDTQTIIHGCGYEESAIDGRSEDMEYIAAANPDTIKKLIAVIIRLKEGLKYYALEKMSNGELIWDKESEAYEALEDCEKIVSGE